MHIKLLMIGKNKDSFAEAAIVDYAGRVERFNGFEIKYLKEAKNNKNLTAAMDVEADYIFKELAPNDYVILLDEKGKEYTLVQFAAKIEQLRLKNFRQLVYIAGGAYGFSEKVYTRSNELFALSKMTFTHTHARLIFAEQIYRAFTILNNHPYHHI